MRNHFFELLHLPLMILMLAVFTVTAESQASTPWSPMFENRFRSSITEATVDMLVSELHLSEAQENAVRHAFDGHRAAFRDFVAEHEPIVQEFERAIRRTEARSMERTERQVEREEKFAEIADAQAELDQQFFEEVKTILTEEQLEAWDGFKRRYERARYMRSCADFPEEGIDQIALLEGLLKDNSIDRDEWMDNHPEVKEMLLQYEQALAPVLREWVKIEIDRSRHWDRRLANRKWVGDHGQVYVGEYRSRQVQVAFERQLRRIHQLRRSLVRLNRDYHRILFAELPDDLALPFSDAYVTAALCGAGIPRHLPAAGFVEEILEREDLTEKQREAIEAQLLVYQHRVPELNRRAIRARDAFVVVRLPGGRGRGDRRTLEEEWKRAVDSRMETEQKLIDDVNLLLTPEQQSEVDVPQVPEPRY